MHVHYHSLSAPVSAVHKNTQVVIVVLWREPFEELQEQTRSVKLYGPPCATFPRQMRRTAIQWCGQISGTKRYCCANVRTWAQTFGAHLKSPGCQPVRNPSAGEVQVRGSLDRAVQLLLPSE